MAENSAIEWTDHTANWWWGCFKVSPGCTNCYAETLSNRYGKSIWGPPKTTDRELKKGIWKELPKWNRQAQESGQRKRVFVQSMADFFEEHEQVKEWRWDALALMQDCVWLDFQVLTKRPENVNRMIEESRSHGFSDADMWFTANPHVWIGTSVENQETADERIPELLRIPAAVRFLSCEPLLGPVDLGAIKYGNYYINPLSGYYSNTPLKGAYDGVGMNFGMSGLGRIGWVIVGGESGKKARPMHPDWARSIRDQCQAAGVPFFFKQWGEWMPYNCDSNGFGPNIGNAFYHGINNTKCPDMVKVGKKAAGRMLDGQIYNEFPVVAGA